NIFDISKILELNPDFEFEYDLKKSVREFLEYMNDHPELKWIDEAFDEYCDGMIDMYSSLKKHFK
ncbi:MAG: NAD-dependent dehydratase, partial [Erysipelothrix sp.]|nr:NAD-dependent dehydratase [Erysipelothrix sp.]